MKENSMKTFIVLFFLLALILLSGCKTKTETTTLDTASEEENDLEEENVEGVETNPENQEMQDEIEQMDVNTESSDVLRSSSKKVVIENMRFNPADISINLGDTVEWVNSDSITHTVSFENGNFDVKIPAGSSVTHTFDEIEDNSEVRYFCQFHPDMRGSVLVLN